ncbi:phage holin family protein [Massilia sp. S19_KUP03_FR1]|uniref:phage holin family protein n=1 Tax=Massilia sp. S19_KUP03_FR1 TaxID=3025503 RepID=UPI002FCDD0C1
MRLILTWLINAAALLALPYLMHSVTVTNIGTALIAALVLALVNTLIRPVLVLLTLPVTFLSLGLFVLVINALLFWLVATMVDGFHVAGFWSAFLAAILYSVISWALSTLLLRKDGNS